MLKVAMNVQQIMTELSEAMSEEDKIMVIQKWYLINKKRWLLEFIGSSKIIAFNANGIRR
jgi:hypothetical protein